MTLQFIPAVCHLSHSAKDLASLTALTWKLPEVSLCPVALLGPLPRVPRIKGAGCAFALSVPLAVPVPLHDPHLLPLARQAVRTAESLLGRVLESLLLSLLFWHSYRIKLL